MKQFGIQLFIIMILMIVLTGCNIMENNQAISGDKLYITEGYKQQLSAMNLTEVAALPYFTQPFICIAKNAEGQQYAVVFRTSEKPAAVKLPMTYEEIILRVESEGFQVESGTVSFGNLHLFEINKNLVWNFDDGTGKVYLDLEGKVVTDPFKS
jgi:hypothetical protein